MHCPDISKKRKLCGSGNMGYEGLATELHKNADAEGRKIIRAAENSAEKTVDEAQAKAKEIMDSAKKEAHAFVKQEGTERLTSAKLSAKKILDEAKDDAVERAVRAIWSGFKSQALKKSVYPDLFSKLLKEGVEELGTTKAVVYVREEDRQFVSGYKAEALPPEFSGGLIIESLDGKMRVNKTLEEIFSQNKNELRKKIYTKLFS